MGCEISHPIAFIFSFFLVFMSTSSVTRPRWSILYRGSLSSCNYSCTYCPFAKTRNTRAELEQDAIEIERFVDWIAGQDHHDIGILMTPWGEGLIRKHYREAMIRLSHMPHVQRVAIQTNLSLKSDDWFDRADLESLALWTTWHPTQTPMNDFIARCRRLDHLGVNYSVGVVGLRDAFDAIEALRGQLSEEVYLWINAYKREPGYYSEAEVERLTRIDPLFRYNTRRHPSLGKPCQAGSTAFTVDGQGDVRRCHFIKDVIGNVYTSDMTSILSASPCTMVSCGCHIGYIHLDELQLYEVFGEGLMERIPQGQIWRDTLRAHQVRDLAREVIGEGPLP